MAEVDIRKAALEVADKLNIEEGQPTPTPSDEEEQKQEQLPEEGEPAEEEEVGGEEEEEEEELPKKGKYVPISRFNEVWKKLKTTERALEMLLQGQQQFAPPQQPPQPPKVEVPDFDAMTPKEQAQWLLKTVEDMVQKTIAQHVEPIRQETAVERAAREVQACMQKYPDYLDYREEMIKIAERHPTLNAEEVYLLAKGDKGTVAKSVAKRVLEKTQLKKKAKVETRSSSAAKVVESEPKFKNVREAAENIAKKMGLLKEE